MAKLALLLAVLGLTAPAAAAPSDGPDEGLPGWVCVEWSDGGAHPDGGQASSSCLKYHTNYGCSAAGDAGLAAWLAAVAALRWLASREFRARPRARGASAAPRRR